MRQAANSTAWVADQQVLRKTMREAPWALQDASHARLPVVHALNAGRISLELGGPPCSVLPPPPPPGLLSCHTCPDQEMHQIHAEALAEPCMRPSCTRDCAAGNCVCMHRVLYSRQNAFPASFLLGDIRKS
jgi:hypothetical protein